ncbi:MAG: LysR substrate-binding domain-containing protein [Desulfovibrionaceae bacterium]|nr:LysR substrate-binding domain-containing protein [Desulfovibrionaceae bacterium]
MTSDTVDRDIFRICGFTPHIVHQTKQIAIICKLVKHGMGLAFLPDLPQIHASDFGIVFRDLEITLPDVICYAVYKKNRLSPAMKNFIQLIELHDKDHAEQR